MPLRLLNETGTPGSLSNDLPHYQHRPQQQQSQQHRLQHHQQRYPNDTSHPSHPLSTLQSFSAISELTPEQTMRASGPPVNSPIITASSPTPSSDMAQLQSQPNTHSQSLGQSKSRSKGSNSKSSKVPTPVSPPPSPPPAGGNAHAVNAPTGPSTGTGPDTHDRDEIVGRSESPASLVSLSPEAPNPSRAVSAEMSKTTPPLPVSAPREGGRGGSSIASLIHSDDQDVNDTLSFKDRKPREQREADGSPPSPDSLPHTHSRHHSMAESNATNATNATSAPTTVTGGTASTIDGRQDSMDMMDVDRPTPLSVTFFPTATLVETPTSAVSLTATLLPSRAPEGSAGPIGTGGAGGNGQPAPRSAAASPQPHASSPHSAIARPHSRQAYQHQHHAALPPTAVSAPSTVAYPSRPQPSPSPSRPNSHWAPSTQQQQQQQPPNLQPAASPRSQAHPAYQSHHANPPSHSHPTPGTGSGSSSVPYSLEELERYTADLKRHMQATIDRQQADIDHHLSVIENLKKTVRQEEEHYAIWRARIQEWIREGSRLLLKADHSAGAVAQGHGHGHGQPQTPGPYSASSAHAHAHMGARNSATAAMPLSSAIVGPSISDPKLDHERTLSAVSPGSPYPVSAHTRPSSAIEPRYGHRQHPQAHSQLPQITRRPSQTPVTPHSAHPHPHPHAHAHQHPQPPPMPAASSGSLRRARRPSSDDLAMMAGNKRFKSDNGEPIRISPEAPLSRERLEGHYRSSSGIPARRGQAIPVSSLHHTADRIPGSHEGVAPDEVLMARNGRHRLSHDEEEDGFPSPRRKFAMAADVPISMSAPIPTKRSPTTEIKIPSATGAGDDPEADADGSPELDTNITAAAATNQNVEAYQELMELGEDDEAEAHYANKRRRDMRTGSRSSFNSQDMEELLDAAAGPQGDEFNPSRRGVGLKRYKGSSGVAPNPGGSISSFPLHPGTNVDVSNPGQPRSYTPSSQPPSAKFVSTSSGAPTQAASNSRGFVFRNTDAADMEAHAQARSPLAEPGHRPSLSGGSLSGVTSHLSPPTTGPLVTMQFLPPQSGPPQPKKIYHSKGTGQVIGSQNVGISPGLAGSADHSAPSAPGSAPTVNIGAGGNPPSRQPSAVGPSTMLIDGMPKRTCKQCGQPGRYKDNKCVEKWGPGPQGPGTVCDRCRKKMKRVEKRATQDSTVVATAAHAHAHAAGVNHHPYPLAPAPSNGSFSQLSSQGSQRYDESQDYGYSQQDESQTQPSLSRNHSLNHPSMHHPSNSAQAQLGRRGSYAPDQAQGLRRDGTLASSYISHSSLQPAPSRNGGMGGSGSASMPPPPAGVPSPFPSAYAQQQDTRRRESPSQKEIREADRKTGAIDTNGAGASSGDGDGDGDAEMDELAEDDIGAAMDVSVPRSGNRIKSEGA